jgi:hypothetical protein
MEKHSNTQSGRSKHHAIKVDGSAEKEGNF